MNLLGGGHGGWTGCVNIFVNIFYFISLHIHHYILNHIHLHILPFGNLTLLKILSTTLPSDVLKTTFPPPFPFFCMGTTSVLIFFLWDLAFSGAIRMEEEEDSPRKIMGGSIIYIYLLLFIFLGLLGNWGGVRG